MKRVLICGDRHWEDRKKITKVLHKLLEKWGKTGFIVIEGEADGADRIAAQIARNHGIHVARVDALWEEYGNPAGPIRNKAMLALQPDLVVAFHPDLTYSKGTKDMIKLARKNKIKVVHIK